ncbi:MAG: hypothetical protein HPY90_14785 [Syntrophothermus sp.]|uniref:hypothetical protein n=1 Tax=Syntrophothermus sp. TaxID=2736299 RepID=UPI00257E47B3|nr:hypothetical protein [Syntrophothermus sp.]NSW84486.1 hypothetical protein [Syntrophothermus sp.]
MIADACWLIGSMWHFFRRKAVRLKLESSLEEVGKEINRRVPGSVPPVAKIRWVPPDQVRSIIEDGKIVLFLTFDKKDEVFKEAVATYHYVKAGFL